MGHDIRRAVPRRLRLPRTPRGIRRRTLLSTVLSTVLWSGICVPPARAQPSGAVRPDVQAEERLRVPESVIDRERLARPWLLRYGPQGVDSIAVSGRLELQPTQDLGVLVLADTVLAVEEAGWPTGSAGRPTYAVPELYYARTAAGTVEPFRLVFTEGEPLRFRRPAATFEGSLMVGLDAVESSGAGAEPADPLGLTVLAGAEEIDPGSLELSRAGFEPRFVALRDADPAPDSVEVRLVTASNPDGYLTWIGVRPSVVIETRSRSLQGGGLQEIPVTVVVRGTTLSDSVVVQLDPTRGTVSPDRVVVRPRAPARARLRSEGSGDATLVAVTALYGTDEVEFQYDWPWLFLLLGALGAAVGAVLRREKDEGLGRWGLRALRGLVVMVVYTALALNLTGFPLPDVPLFNEGAVFAVGLLGALRWSPRSKPSGDQEAGRDPEAGAPVGGS